MSPALAGRLSGFLTTAPPGKSQHSHILETKMILEFKAHLGNTGKGHQGEQSSPLSTCNRPTQGPAPAPAVGDEAPGLCPPGTPEGRVWPGAETGGGGPGASRRGLDLLLDSWAFRKKTLAADTTGVKGCGDGYRAAGPGGSQL